MGIAHKGFTVIKESKKIVTNFYHRKFSDIQLKKIYIAGIQKCGSTSLEKFLTKRGFHVVREESMFDHYAGLKKYKFQYPDYQTLFILRDPIERVWSHYHYKRYYQQGDRKEINCSFEEALTKHSKDIVLPSDYERWIKRWISTNPIIVKLEELKKMDDFPYINSTSKEEISEFTKKKIIDACRKQGFDPLRYASIQHDNSLFEN